MHRYSNLIVLGAVVFGAVLPAAGQTGTVVLKSPDGALEMTIGTVRGQAVQDSGGQLAYSVAFHGTPMLSWSNLGLAIEGTPVLGAAVRIESSKPSSQDETWKAIAGKASTIRNHYNAVTVQTVETAENGRRLTLEARAYDDGVAFRYLVPEQAGVKQLRILNEVTQFRFIKDATTWSLISRGFQTSNEDDYHELTIRGLHPEYLVNLPMMIEVPGVAWVGLTEAYLEDYPNLFVTNVGDVLTARLATYWDDLKTNANIAPSFDAKADAAKVSVITQAPMKSPWRVLMIGTEPGRVVESNMVVNLNPPCALADTSWIKPGKTSWNWWNGSQAKGVAQPGMNNETMKYYIDFSARNNFEYLMIDAGWAARTQTPSPSGSNYTDITKSNANIDLPMLVEYGTSKNVGIWLWAHFTDMNHQLDEAMVQMEKWGVKGIKIDYLDRTDQWMVNWCRTVAKKAAEHHLMIDFHGAYKPNGLRRTYPNVLTHEGVMGAEYNKWSARETAKHNVTLAFTRMLAGPMDYTPGGFDNVTKAEFAARNRAPMVMHTRAHAAALFVVIESAFQMVADSPDAYDGQKETEFLKAVPAAWDETRVVSGVPPKYITIARRSGNDWFLGSITDDARELDVPLSFLGNGSYTAEIYSDGPNAATQPKDSVMEKRTVNSKTVLKLKLAPTGGAAIHFTPAR